MKFKIIFGIIIPIILVIGLAIVASQGNVLEERNFVSSINLEDIFDGARVRTSIKVGEINLKNDYFMGKRHELPEFSTCLIDNDKEKGNMDAGEIRYSEGKRVREEGPFDNYDRYTSIELSSDEEKKIYVYLVPDYRFQRKNQIELLEEFEDYDELIIYDLDDSDYDYNSYDYECQGLHQKLMEESVRIKINK